MSFFDSYPVLQEALLTTKTGRTFKGVIWQRRHRYLVMRNAIMLREHEEPLAMGGELVIAEANVDYIQVVG